MKTFARTIAVTGGIVLLAIALVWFFTPYTSRHFTCLYCRAFKRVVTYASLPIESVSETTCSRWYSKSFVPHEHSWVQSSCTYHREGLSIGYACRPGPSIWWINADTQLQFLSRSTSQQRADFFRQVQSDNKDEVHGALEFASRLAGREF